ncbi:hypothetical protein AB0H57_14370 [Micromonospora sp. NPDC050686]|uniref:hypothetical protein n=1 Tax=Micromonospora sp. NPDC050686 TaxID=3154631 RepID=UPI003407475B
MSVAFIAAMIFLTLLVLGMAVGVLFAVRSGDAGEVTVYHALAFYHAHPDLRPELGTPAALDRIAAGRAAVPR